MADNIAFLKAKLFILLCLFSTFLPNLLSLDFTDSNNNKIYEIKLNKENKEKISMNMVISFPYEVISMYTYPSHFHSYIVLTVETPNFIEGVQGPEPIPASYISQQYIKVPLADFITNVQSDVIIEGKSYSFKQLNFKLSMTFQEPKYPEANSSIDEGTFFTTSVYFQEPKNE